MTSREVFYLSDQGEDYHPPLPVQRQEEPFGLDAMIKLDPQERTFSPLASTESITWTTLVTEEGDEYQQVDKTAKSD